MTFYGRLRPATTLARFTALRCLSLFGLDKLRPDSKAVRISTLQRHDRLPYDMKPRIHCRMQPAMHTSSQLKAHTLCTCLSS